MIAVLCFSCNRYKNDDEPLGLSQSFNEYDPNIVKPLKVGVGKSSIKVSCEIKSEKEGDGYILVQLEKGAKKGFGDEVLIEGYEIFGYYLMIDRESITYSPLTEFPAFMKKVKLPENKSFIEEFTIHFPDEFTEIAGSIWILRNNKDIEDYMNTKLYPDFYKDKYYYDVEFASVLTPPIFFEHYYKLFPESSVFAYIWLHHRELTPIDKRLKKTRCNFALGSTIEDGFKEGDCVVDVLGFDNIMFVWPPLNPDTSGKVLIYPMPNLDGNH